MIANARDKDILAVLSEDAGVTTSWVSDKIINNYCRSNNRMRSGAVRSWLMSLKKIGWVDFLDDQKPACWKRTPEGTAALNQEPYE